MPDLTIVECRSCRAPIVWATTEKGKRIPLDATPVVDGQFVVIGTEHDGSRRSPRVRFDHEGVAGDHYTAHFSTCPNADHHRRPR